MVRHSFTPRRLRLIETCLWRFPGVMWFEIGDTVIKRTLLIMLLYLFAGTFHEWTIGNQSPGGSAKLSKTSLDLAFFGIRLQQRKRTEANVLRTHAPHGFDGMEKIGYYGSWPMSKFDIGK